MKENKENLKLFFLFGTMFKIGCIGFGGGNALIPILQKILVEDKKIVKQNEFEQDVIVANITPGALPVEVASGVGKRISGWKGMLVGSMGMALPGVLLTVFILSFVSYLNENILRQIEFATIGITAFILCLLTDYVVKTLQHNLYQERIWRNAGVILLIFIFTCGKNLFRLFEIKVVPFFALTTIHIFVLVFFLIFYTCGNLNIVNGLISGALCGLYLLCEGQNHLIKSEFVYNIIRLIMIILALRGLWKQSFQDIKREKLKIEQLIKELLVLIILLFVTGIIAVLITKKAILYLENGFLSSLISFGGGDSYLTVADGLFVETNLVKEEEFYGSLVPLVNILPGSILCKTLSGIGFFIGYYETNNICLGYLVALVGFLCSIVASCGVFSVASCLYEVLEQLPVLKLLKYWIRIIVSGLMLTVMLSLIYQNRKIGITTDIGWSSVILMGLIYGFNVFFYYRKGMNSWKRILISIVVSVVVCNIIVI